MVRIARRHGVLTPEDPYPVVELGDSPVLVVPLFLLYDYSFRPPHVRRDEVVRWARETGSACADEVMLRPDPFPDRESWCAARCKDAASRLASYPADLPKVLVNHFPLEEQHAVLPRVAPFHSVVRDPPDPGLAPPLQRLRRGVRPPPHPGHPVA